MSGRSSFTVGTVMRPLVSDMGWQSTASGQRASYWNWLLKNALRAAAEVCRASNARFA
jgi:hypothetical protein